jgi:uncharacterized protein (DUF1330 family)
MAKGYWVASVDVSDPEGYKLYVAEKRNAFQVVYGTQTRKRKRLSRVGFAKRELNQRIILSPNALSRGVGSLL